jgi:hypothetical protein
MTNRAACPPPPVGKSATLHSHTLNPHETLYRVYRGTDPAVFRRSSTNNRFDPLPAPWDTTEVLYAGSSREVAISETVLRWHDRTDPSARVILARSQIAGRQLIGLKWDRPLQILDFTGFGLKPLSELISDGRAEDIFLSDASQYGRTQQWGAWFRSTYPDAAGFRWMSRQHNSSACYVFLKDACRGHNLIVADPREQLEPGTRAFGLLEECLELLRWEVEW